MPGLRAMGSSVGGTGSVSAPAVAYQGTNWAGALGAEESNYQNVLQGYQTALNSQRQNQQQIQQGYNTLSQNVMGTIQGIDQSQAQAIRDAYAQQSGQLSQQMINSGLGNSTVQGSMQRGLTLDQQKAQIALANQTAQLRAGYQSQLGMAGLNYQNQAAMQDTALYGQGLQSMQGNINQFSGIYGHLAGQEQQQQFQAQQAALDRQLRSQQFNAQLQAQQGHQRDAGIANAYQQANRGQGVSRFGARDPYTAADQGYNRVSNVLPATGYGQIPTSYQAPQAAPVAGQDDSFWFGGQGAAGLIASAANTAADAGWGGEQWY